MLLTHRIRHGNYATLTGISVNPVDGSDAAHRGSLGCPASCVKRPSVSIRQGEHGWRPPVRRATGLMPAVGAQSRKSLANWVLQSKRRSRARSGQPATAATAPALPAAVWATLVMCRALGR